MKAEWELFANEYIKTGDHIAAYLVPYPNNTRKVAATKAKQLLNKPEIAAFVQEGKRQRAEIISAVRNEEIAELAKGTMLSEEEVDAAMCDIIAGRLKLTKPMVVKGKIEYVPCVPTYQDRINAAAQYYQRFGSYSAKKTQQIGADGQPVNPAAPVTNQVFILNMPDGVDISFPSNTDGE